VGNRNSARTPNPRAPIDSKSITKKGPSHRERHGRQCQNSWAGGRDLARGGWSNLCAERLGVPEGMRLKSFRYLCLDAHLLFAMIEMGPRFMPNTRALGVAYAAGFEE